MSRGGVAPRGSRRPGRWRAYDSVMSTTTPTSGLEQTRRLGVETTGIEIIDESERTAKPRDLFWPWFAANVSVFGLSYASFVLYFGISFWQGVAGLRHRHRRVVPAVRRHRDRRQARLGADDDPQPGGVRGERPEGAGRDLVAGLDRLGDVPRDPRRARHLDDLHAARLGRRRRHQGRRGGRRRRADRLGERRRLPHHHADAVRADLDHRDRHGALHGADRSTTSTGRPCRTSRPARPRRSSARSSW